MSNFIFTSHFQKRFENGNLTAVSEKDYSFQNIPIGYGDKTLANTVIDFCIDRVVSFEIVNQDKQRDKEPYVLWIVLSVYKLYTIYLKMKSLLCQ